MKRYLGDGVGGGLADVGRGVLGGRDDTLSDDGENHLDAVRRQRTKGLGAEELAMARAHGVQTVAARMLGISQPALSKRLKKGNDL